MDRTNDNPIVPAQPRQLAPVPGNGNTSPVAAYLAGLSSGSRRRMLGALNTIAALATDGRGDARSFDWHRLRYQRSAAQCG